MDYKQNSDFNDLLFSKNKNDYESNISDNSDDIEMPPELSEIRNLNEANTYQAPTMDVLGPANFLSGENNQYDKIYQPNDPLDLYESGKYVNPDLKREDELNNPISVENSDNDDDFSKADSDDHFTSFFSRTNDSRNKKISDINISDNFSDTKLSNESLSNDFDHEYLKKINLDTNLSNNDIDSVLPNTKSYDIPKDNVSSSSLSDFNIENDNKADYEVVNKDLASDAVDETEDGKSQLSSYESLDELPKEDVFNEDVPTSLHNDADFDIENDNKADYEVVNKDLASDVVDETENRKSELNSYESLDKLPNEDVSSNDVLTEQLPEDEMDEITDISSLGIDDAYNTDDSLEILESDDINIEQEADDEDDYVEKIKNLIEKMQKDGKKVKLEEFDFENMHQLIIILEK